MAKSLSRFVCQECGAVLSKWMGQCDVCKSWNCVVEEVAERNTSALSVKVPDNFFVGIEDASNFQSANVAKRHKTRFKELDRVLGGGFVDGSVVLLGGAPGIGKSTLLLQILSEISGINDCVYISAEESVSQVMMRAKRLGVQNSGLRLAASSDIHQILAAVSNMKRNSVLVVDSIQTISSNLIQSPPGSISQVRFCTQELVNFAKLNDVVVIIVGHITKDGAIAGPKTLEHMVDCVLYFEGDKAYDYRILRGEKNRYGATDEIGVFSMATDGLHEVANPSSAFLSEYDNNVSGVAVFSGIEGTRPILSEIQALVSNTSVAVPRRSSIGFDPYRLSMLVAVLSTRCKLNFSNKDVYLNVAGGLKITEPAIDLAVVAAVISSAFRKPLPGGAVFFGEVSLSGEVRQSHLSFSRIKEAQKLGFKTVFCSHKTEDFEADAKINIHKIKSIRDILGIIR
ncbi:MAG: DNA repair protein RadA [Alphaproteobacteria bacterium]|nr:DNA repair protein RadA [Alphaproteobacteria bacterium]